MADKLYTADIQSRIPGLGKNAVINGNFNIAQRGTTVPINGTVLYGLDCWKTFKTSSAILNMSQYAGAPTFAQSGHKSVYSLEMKPTTANTPLGATEYLILSHPIEGFRLTPFIGKVVTLSFWLMATKTGATCVKVIAYGDGREIMKEFTISQSLTWEKYTWTFKLDSSMTFNQGNTAGLGINFSLGAGINYQGAETDVWTDFTYQCTSNQVNHLDSTSNVFRLSQVKLEVGDSATPFEDRDPATELALCQRYYEKSYDINTAPGAATDKGAISVLSRDLGCPGFSFQTQKRAAPTITIYDDDGHSGYVKNVTDGVDESVSSIPDITTSNVRVIATSVPSTSPARLHYHWTADASL